MAYDSNNVFAKILRGDIPSQFIYEDDYVVAFHDIRPKAPTHVLVVPKKAYTDLNDFMQKADADEVYHVMQDVTKVAAQLDVVKAGYRVVINVGTGAGQEVPHLHFHILSNKEA